MWRCRFAKMQPDGADITCPAGWTQVALIGQNTNDAAYQSYPQIDVSSYISSTFAVRFSTADGSSLGSTDYIWFDNIQIEAINPALTWPASLLGNMAPNQQITITYTAQTTQTFNAGDITLNKVEANGSRTVGGVTQTFVTSDFAYNSFTELQITKTSSAVNPLYSGDQFTYTVTVTNPSTATNTLTDLAVYDPLPAGLAYVGPLQVSRRTVGDRFDTAAYNNNNGTDNWTGNWTETIEATNPAAGNILITNGELRLTNNGSTEATITRAVSLTGATTATLSFKYRTDTGVDAADIIYVQAFYGGIWNTVGTFTGITGATSGTFSAGINTGTTSIRFSFPNGSYEQATELFYVDDLHITYDVSRSDATTTPPNLISGSQGYALRPNQSLTITYTVQVVNPLPTGIDSITNTASATSSEVLLPLSASVTNIVSNPSSESAEVGDRVWLDANGNGALDVGEPGLANVEVTLKDRFGAPVMTTMTDATGHYLFTGIAAGTGYYIELTSGTLPAGLQQSAPAGHTDNRTGTFNLIAGQSYRDANLGYNSAPGKATIGDYVWSDANADNRRNAGEAGLAGVTVELWRDVNGNGIKDAGDAICIIATCGTNGTTTTAPDGSYLFTGVTASGTQDYIVYIDETQAALSGYTRTSPPSGDALFSVINISSGASILDANFGYQGTTYSIKDRVWFDVSNYGTMDSGEPGISGVTVDLLDASLNVIATTTTAADGTFTFTGVADGGADYSIKITDTGGKLTDYFGTTSYSLAGSKQVVNLTGDIDSSATPSFGYNLSRAIGDTVFNDNGAGTGGILGNGIQEGSEPGIPDVTVLLYLDDGDNVFEPGTGAGRDGNPLAALVTDSDGRYHFSGLANGTYWVQIDNTQSALSGLTLTTADDSGVVGHQRKVTMSGSTDLGIDFGYQASTPRNVTGALWEDADKNGAIDTGEVGLSGVTIELLNASLTVVATTTTLANGTYSFVGIPSGTPYYVRITDNDGVLTGYTATWEKTELLAGPFNGQETVNLSGGDITGINFGFFNAIPTQVVLSYFGAFERNGEVIVEWKTASELDTLGFNLLRLDPVTGEYKQINSGLLPAILRPHRGGRYTIKDTGASPGKTYTYKLIEVEIFGKELSYGPFTVFAGKKKDNKGTYLSPDSNYHPRGAGSTSIA